MNGDLNFYKLIRPALFSLDSEVAHNLIRSIGRNVSLIPLLSDIQRRLCSVRSDKLRTSIFGIEFENPIGLAAGFDKHGELIDFMAALGFGFVELGSVSNLPSMGNAKPRLFRLIEDEALINRMGLNNPGPDQFLRNIRLHQAKLPIAINVVKTHNPEIMGEDAVRDIVSCYAKVQAAANFIVLNVSCPNTSEGKTFESPDALRELLGAIKDKRKELASTRPILVKFSSDLSLAEFDRALEVCEDFNVDGYVLVNTSTKRSGLKEQEARLAAIGNGGISGKPLFASGLEKIRHAHRALRGSKPLIGVGGVHSPEAAYALLKAGASLVELYTGLVYEGPGLVRKINRGLVKFLERDGATRFEQIRGTG